jgi:uncharacterized protein (TIGR02611 family)
MQEVKRQSRRIGVALSGGAVMLLGFIAIPYPGPGWLIVFAGLAILATEFEWARRLLTIARSKYNSWQEWLKHQNMAVRVAILVLMGIFIIATLWLLNMFGLLDHWFGLHQAWVHSPLGIFE